MSLSKYKSIYKKLYPANRDDERFCLICNKKLQEENTLESLFLQDRKICMECVSQFIVHRQVYEIDGILIYVYFEYNEFLERLLFRYKEQKDIVLKDVFSNIFLKEWKDKYCVCIPPSSDEKRMERAFEPLMEIYNGNVYSPLYKISAMKQSSQSFLKRKEIKEVIYKKRFYPLVNKPIVLLDDVCTSQNTINRCIELLHPIKVYVLAAHPLWIESKNLEKHYPF